MWRQFFQIGWGFSRPLARSDLFSNIGACLFQPCVSLATQIDRKEAGSWATSTNMGKSYSLWLFLRALVVWTWSLKTKTNREEARNKISAYYLWLASGRYYMYRKRIGENKGISFLLSTLRNIKAGCQQSQEGIEEKSTVFLLSLKRKATRLPGVERTGSNP